MAVEEFTQTRGGAETEATAARSSAVVSTRDLMISRRLLGVYLQFTLLPARFTSTSHPSTTPAIAAGSPHAASADAPRPIVRTSTPAARYLATR